MLRKLLGRKKTPSAPTTSALLTDTNYQKLFMQLMEGVAKGWSESQINPLLDQRQNDDAFVNWLYRYNRDTLQQNSEQYRELAQQMMQLGELNCGAFGKFAGELGQQIASFDQEKTEVKSIDLTDEVLQQAERFKDEGRQLLDAGKYQQALACLDQALANKSNDLARSLTNLTFPTKSSSL